MIRRMFLLSIALMPAGAIAQGTAFTYQGRLEDEGVPADGAYDLRFRLFDAVSAGAQVGSTICVDNADVIRGLFTVLLDFGQQFATPEERHLEVDVRVDAGLNCGNASGFVVLAPRQPITAAPQALHAISADTALALDAPDDGPQGAVFVGPNGNVGIGTSAPTTKLEVAGAAVVGSIGDQVDALWLAIERSWVFRQQGTGAGTALKLQSIGGGGNKNFLIETTGSVGIGTTAPAATLDVRGDIRFGSTGQFFAPSGTENLRIVRGTINLNGPDQGSGFTVVHPGTGQFTIQFATDFTTPPTVTATAAFEGVSGIVQVEDVSISSVMLRIFARDTGLLVDRDVYFIAIGPR